MSTRARFLSFVLISLLLFLPGLTVAGLEVPVPARLEEALELYRKGDLERSRSALLEVLPELRGGGDSVPLGEALNVLSLIATSFGEYEAAAGYAAEAAELRRRLGDAAGEAASLNNLGLAHLYLGDYGQALARYQEALQIDRRTGDVRSEVLRLNNIANVHYFRGSYSDSLALYLQALEMLDARGDAEWAGRERYRTQANLAVLYQKLGLNGRALAIYQELLRSSEQIDGDAEARILTNIGVLYRHLGDPVKALESYRRARALFARWRHQAGEIGVLRNLGILQSMNLGDHVAAIETFSEVIAHAGRSGNRRTEVHGRLYRSEALRLEGRLDAANADLEAALQGARTLGTAEEEWKALYGLGRIAQLQGRSREASAHFQAAVDTIESLRARLDLSSMRPGFLADKRAVFDALIASHLAEAETGESRGDLAEVIFGLMERSRSRMFQDSMRSSIEQLQRRIAPKEMQQLKEIRGRLASLWSRQLVTDSLALEESRGELNRLENDYVRVQESLRSAVPLGSASPPDFAAVQASMKGRGIDLVIEYWLGDGYLAWVWTTPDRSGFGSGSPPSAGEVSTCVASLADASNAGWRADCRRLAEVLLRPIRLQQDPPPARIAIISDGFLQLVPFEALEIEDGTLLVEESAIEYLPSAASLLDRSTSEAVVMPFPWQPALTAIGDPVPVGPDRGDELETWPRIPNSRREILDIAEILPGTKSLFLGPEATKSELPWQAEGPVPILHLATHAAIDLENSDRSRILFSGSQSRGPYEYLFLREFPDLDLSGTHLVTLSACETSRGQILAGEGSQDFSRILLLAGARVAVTSLWRVSDEGTPEFMKQFYFRISCGSPVSDALREAKLTLLRSGSSLSHPAYWAAFVATGEASVPVPLPVSWGTAGMVAAAVILGFLMTAFWWRSYRSGRPARPGEPPVVPKPRAAHIPVNEGRRPKREPR